MDIYSLTKTASAKVDQLEVEKGHKLRTLHSVFLQAQAEMGELAEEINIHTGLLNKPAGKDGILGEAIDSILCLLDLIHVLDPNIAQGIVNDIAQAKLDKWINHVSKDKLSHT